MARPADGALPQAAFVNAQVLQACVLWAEGGPGDRLQPNASVSSARRVPANQWLLPCANAAHRRFFRCGGQRCHHSPTWRWGIQLTALSLWQQAPAVPGHRLCPTTLPGTRLQVRTGPASTPCPGQGPFEGRQALHKQRARRLFGEPVFRPFFGRTTTHELRNFARSGCAA